MATRCCWPPESSLGRCSAFAPMPTMSIARATRLSRSALDIFCLPVVSGNSTFLATVMCDHSARSWNTMERLRLFTGTLVPGPKTSRPANWITPASGVSSPAMQRSRVDLPQPEGPRTETNSPFAMSREVSWSPVPSANSRRTPLKET